jgi:hypothetical protein
MSQVLGRDGNAAAMDIILHLNKEQRELQYPSPELTFGVEFGEPTLSQAALLLVNDSSHPDFRTSVHH